MYTYQKRLNAILKNIWYQFEKSGWKIEHRIHATNRLDEEFTKQYSTLSNSFI